MKFLIISIIICFEIFNANASRAIKQITHHSTLNNFFVKPVLNSLSKQQNILIFFLNADFSDKNNIVSNRELLCSNLLEKIFKWHKLMLQWFVFLKFAEFTESSALFRKNSIVVEQSNHTNKQHVPKTVWHLIFKLPTTNSVLIV